MSAPGSTGRIIGAYKVVERLPRAHPHYIATKIDGDPERRYVLSVAAIDEEDIDRIWTEVERYALLRHPSIAQVREFFEHEGSFVLVFDYGEGVGLDKLKLYLERDRERLPDAAIWYVGHQVAGALARLHSGLGELGQHEAIPHGHISPQDVLISWEGEVTLVGFCAPLSVTVASLRPDTIEEARCYMAPELTNYGPPTQKGDVFAAAMLLWSLLTGRSPPLAGAAPSLASLRPDLPGPIVAAIDTALRHDLAQRTTSCLELEGLLDGMVRATQGMAELAETMEMYRALWGLWSIATPGLFDSDAPPADSTPPAASPVPAVVEENIGEEFELEEHDDLDEDVPHAGSVHEPEATGHAAAPVAQQPSTAQAPGGRTRCRLWKDRRVTEFVRSDGSGATPRRTT